jgi:ATP-binding cassette subfamily C protein
MKSYARLFRELFDRRLPLMMAVMALAAITEGLSITLLLPLLSRLGISYSVGAGSLGAFLQNVLSAVDSRVGPLGLLVALTGVAAAQMVFALIAQWWMTSASRQYQARRQKEIISALMRARWDYLNNKKLGELTHIIAGDGERLANAVFIGYYLIATLIGVVIYLALAVAVSWQVTLLLCAASVVISICVLPLYRMSYTVGCSISTLNTAFHAVLVERIGGIKMVKAMACEDNSIALADGLIGKMVWASGMGVFLPATARATFEFLAFIVLASIFIFGSSSVGIAPGSIIIVFALFVRLFPRMTTLQGYLHVLNTYLHSFEVFDNLQHSAEANAEPTISNVSVPPLHLPACLRFEDVDISVDGRKLLDQVSLSIPAPGLVGIVGGSGTGKSTVIHAILGLLSCERGVIAFDSRELATTPLSVWRRQFGYVPQETILFHSSVFDNIALARPDATAAEVERAAARANADQFIRALPEGYQTIVGDQGVKLSGGQRQRIGIARALLCDAKMLLLDEATSALDAESEAEFLKTVEILRRQIGVLMVTHRTASLQTADNIFVVDRGRIVASGPWRDLAALQSPLPVLADAKI